jgi:hypothetical protein
MIRCGGAVELEKAEQGDTALTLCLQMTDRRPD